MADAITHSLFRGKIHQLSRLLRGRRQGLFTRHVFARQKRLFGHGKVFCVGRADVDRLNCSIVQDGVVVRRRGGNGKARGQPLGAFNVNVGEGRQFHPFQPTHCVQMYAADKARTQNCRLDLFHPALLAQPGTTATIVRANCAPSFSRASLCRSIQQAEPFNCDARILTSSRREGSKPLALSTLPSASSAWITAKKCLAALQPLHHRLPSFPAGCRALDLVATTRSGGVLARDNDSRTHPPAS